MHADALGHVALGAKYVAWRSHEVDRALSFALYRGGFQTTRAVMIHEIRNEDLDLEVDAAGLLAARMRAIDPSAVGMLTSRRVDALEVATAAYEATAACAVVTLGMSNAVRVGDTPGPLTSLGTINIICRVDQALSDVGLLEAMTLVAEARTAAVLDARMPSRRSGEPATGTGTDCITVLCPQRPDAPSYAGKHTAVGHVIGRSAYTAVSTALARWRVELGQ